GHAALSCVVERVKETGEVVDLGGVDVRVHEPGPSPGHEEVDHADELGHVVGIAEVTTWRVTEAIGIQHRQRRVDAAADRDLDETVREAPGRAMAKAVYGHSRRGEPETEAPEARMQRGELVAALIGAEMGRAKA